MIKSILVACAAIIFLGGCAVNPKDITGVTGVLSNAFAALQTHEELNQALAEEFLRQTAELEYLSARQETCRDNEDAAVRDLRTFTPKEVRAKEAKFIRDRFAELYFLQKYSVGLAKFATTQTARNAELDALAAIAASPGSLTISPPEAKAIAAAAKIVIEAVKAAEVHQTNYEIMKAAEKIHPTIRKMVASMKKKFHLVGDGTQLLLNAWYSCAEEKYIYMRNTLVVRMPTSAVDLDNSYGAFQAQYRAFINRVPSIAGVLDELEAANEKIFTTSVEEFSTTTQQLATTVNSVISAYSAVKQVRTTFERADAEVALH